MGENGQGNVTGSGASTSEYTVAQSGGFWGTVAIVLGVIVAVGPEVLDAFGDGAQSSPAYAIAGACISVAGVIYRTLIGLGYIKSRTAIKTQQDGGTR